MSSELDVCREPLPYPTLPYLTLHLWAAMQRDGVKPTYGATERVLEVCAEHKLYAKGVEAGQLSLGGGMHVDRR